MCKTQLTVHDVHAQRGGRQTHEAQLQALAGVTLQAVLVSRALQGGRGEGMRGGRRMHRWVGKVDA
jgi:hypothetical protein